MWCNKINILLLKKYDVSIAKNYLNSEGMNFLIKGLVKASHNKEYAVQEFFAIFINRNTKNGVKENNG